MIDFVNDLVAEQAKKIRQAEEDLVKLKLKEKGFGRLIEGMEKRRFPKVCAIDYGGWAYYYADDDTEEGAFIVAIKKPDFGMDDKNLFENPVSYKMTISFQWQDTHPLVIKPWEGRA